MRPMYIVFALIVIILVGVVAWLVAIPGASDFLATKRTITDPEEVNDMALAFVSLPYPDDYNITRVPGYIENLSGLKFAEVTIEIQLLTPEGDKKELIEQTVREIEPGTRRSFDINAGTIGESRKGEVRILEITVVD